MLVAYAIEGREDLFTELRAFGEDLFDQLYRGISKAGQVGILRNVQHVPQNEHLITDRGTIGHEGSETLELSAQQDRLFGVGVVGHTI